MNITLSLEPTFFGPFVSSSLCVFGFVHCQYRESGVASFPGAPLPPKADQRQEEVGPECATTHPGPSQPSAHPRPSGEPSGLRPGNGTEVQKGGGRKTHLLYITFREGRLSIFHATMLQIKPLRL